MKPPPAQEVWDQKLGPSRWDKIWGARAMYSTPRDKAAQLKLQHRNLWVAKNGGCSDTTCKAPGCQHEESQEHLWTCQIIQQEFWGPILEDMRNLGMNPSSEAAYGILGIHRSHRATKEELGVLQMAWRNLYAQSVKTKLEEGEMDLPLAVYKTWRLVLSRVQAHGNLWRRWFLKQTGHIRPKIFPLQHRKHKLIELDEEANYKVNPKLGKIVEEARNKIVLRST